MVKIQEPIQVAINIKNVEDGGSVLLTHLVKYLIQKSLEDESCHEIQAMDKTNID